MRGKERQLEAVGHLVHTVLDCHTCHMEPIILGGTLVLAQQRHCNRFAAFGRRDDLHADSLPLTEGCQARPFDNRDVHEHIFLAIVGEHKAEAFVTLEPFDRPFDGVGCPGIVALAPAGCSGHRSHRRAFRSGGTRINR
jgi:hypothetical protein